MPPRHKQHRAPLAGGTRLFVRAAVGSRPYIINKYHGYGVNGGHQAGTVVVVAVEAGRDGEV